MGKLADELRSNGTQSHPRRYSHRIRIPYYPKDVREYLEFFGHNPDATVLDGPMSIRHSELANGEVVTTVSYKLFDAPQPVDLDGIVERLRGTEQPVGISGDWAFVFQASDLQIGKIASGGATADILEKYWESVDSAYDRYVELLDMGYSIGYIQLSFPGDCIEGTVSQGGKNIWLTQNTVTEQNRIFRRLLTETVRVFAPLANTVYLDVVNGNHDESTRTYNSYPGDGWATECALAVSDALSLARIENVYVRVPDQWQSHMTVPVGNSKVVVAHGHQWQNGRAMEWWKEQVFGNNGPESAYVLQNGHWHTPLIKFEGARTQIQSATFDGGSDWYRDKHGTAAHQRRGALTYLLKDNVPQQISLV
ncbi:exonuclease [Gordonia phage Keelan]|nr:exonuclease [Gordonia phage Keelan]